MNSTSVAVFAAMAMTMATNAFAREQTPRVPSESQVTQAPYYQPNPQPSEPESRALFTVAGLEGHLWAPVEPHYDADNDRNLAADPLWAG